MHALNPSQILCAIRVRDFAPRVSRPGFSVPCRVLCFRVRVTILVFVFYEPRLTVYSRTVTAEHLREKRKPLSTNEHIFG